MLPRASIGPTTKPLFIHLLFITEVQTVNYLILMLHSSLMNLFTKAVYVFQCNLIEH